MLEVDARHCPLVQHSSTWHWLDEGELCPSSPHSFAPATFVTALHCVESESRQARPKHVEPNPLVSVQLVPAGSPLSSGQRSLVPPQVSAVSHASLAARHTVPDDLSEQVSVQHLASGLPMVAQVLPAFSWQVPQSQQPCGSVVATPQSHCSPKSTPPFPHSDTGLSAALSWHEPALQKPVRTPLVSDGWRQGCPSRGSANGVPDTSVNPHAQAVALGSALSWQQSAPEQSSLKAEQMFEVAS